MIFMTGQYRNFWETWWNVVDLILLPNRARGMSIQLCLALDRQWKHHQCAWTDDDRQMFAIVLSSVWKGLGFEDHNLSIHWMDRENPYFRRAVASLERYVQKGRLAPHWFEYLIHRSGSCIEYAQFATLYDWCTANDRSADLLLRIRTDVLFRHTLHLAEPDLETATWQSVFADLVPAMASFFRGTVQPEGREYSIDNDPANGRWAITFRKNLIYLMPFDLARIVADMILYYGDWDSADENAFWFNAESQFRGCLRHHGFIVYEYSQICDECFGSFDERFPLYAIQRRMR